MKKSNSKREGAMAVIAALIVLFSAMWNPWISLTVSLIAMIVFAIWKFAKS